MNCKILLYKVAVPYEEAVRRKERSLGMEGGAGLNGNIARNDFHSKKYRSRFPALFWIYQLRSDKAKDRNLSARFRLYILVPWEWNGSEIEIVLTSVAKKSYNTRGKMLFLLYNSHFEDLEKEPLRLVGHKKRQVARCKNTRHGRTSFLCFPPFSE